MEQTQNAVNGVTRAFELEHMQAGLIQAPHFFTKEFINSALSKMYEPATFSVSDR